jgi:Arm DNA-binding domain
MQAITGSMLLSSKVAQPGSKPFEIYDSRLPGFTLRVQPSGVRSYYARFGRNRRIALGHAGSIDPDKARERCQIVLGNVAHGRHPLHGLGGTDEQTASRLESSSRTRTRRGSKQVVRALPPTRSRSFIGTSEPGTRNRSRPSRLSALRRGRRGVSARAEVPQLSSAISSRSQACSDER